MIDLIYLLQLFAKNIQYIIKIKNYIKYKKYHLNMINIIQNQHKCYLFIINKTNFKYIQQYNCAQFQAYLQNLINKQLFFIYFFINILYQNKNFNFHNKLYFILINVCNLNLKFEI
ncbi:hypothetical protein PPERSA_04532 [Pseudocohnilembus persalinus]|uniref:Uncharacterized protein n=1 Tax=Pseudocohnilembus persalinus TaxID=266149 RepID=A0A0V0QTI2_PSEPJ|nr:hypothetical protein PPERSA_04532 [Pseudocohnilembus persalinus]|eukprot:KRX05495.1 hypothetical protein PPERSA_04532 [Pseudocohnilembus persalinus]